MAEQRLGSEYSTDIRNMSSNLFGTLNNCVIIGQVTTAVLSSKLKSKGLN